VKRLAVCTLSALLLTVGVPIAHADEWPQLGFDAAGSNINPNESTISTTSASHWKTRWQHRPNDVRRYTSNPVVTASTVFVAGTKVGHDGIVHPMVWAYALDNGALQWSKRLPCDTLGDMIAYHDGMVVVGVNDCPIIFDGYEGMVFLLDGGTGNRLSSFFTYDPYTITIDGDLAVIPDSNDTISVIDLSTRTLIGQPEYDRDHEWAPVPLGVVDHEAWVGYAATPVFSQGVGVLYGTWARGIPINGDPASHSLTCPQALDVGLCATDLSTGQVLWEKVFSYPPNFLDVEYNPPIVVGDVVYSDGPGVMRALDLHTGDLIWEADAADAAPSNYGWARPIYVNGVLFIQSFDPVRNDAIVLGFDGLTGELVSRRPRTQLLGPLGGRSLAAANGRFVASVPGIRVSTFDRP
jgi:outer membrane protein assembly factor BamB